MRSLEARLAPPIADDSYTAPALPADELLERSRFFEVLPPVARAELAARLRPLEVPAGSDVIREGDDADAYYLIASGEAEVWYSRPGPPEQTLTGRLRSGDGFGEMALLLGGRRQATVRATTDLALLVLDGPSFRTVVSRHRGLALGLEEEMALRAVANYLGRSSALGRLSPEALRWLALRLQAVSFEPGQEIVREGEPGDSFYIVRSGTVEVLRRLADGGETSMATLREGRAFGEQALLSDEPRSATVRATDPVELLRLTREDLDEALDRYESLASHLGRLVMVRQRPRRIDHWVMERQDASGGEAVYIVKDTEKKRYLKLSEQGAYLWELMDGEHTVRDLALAYLKRFGAFRVEAVLESMLGFHAAGFVRIQSVDERGPEVASMTRWARIQAALLPWVTRSFSLRDPDAALTRLHRRLGRAIYGPVGQALLLVLAIAGAALFIRNLALGESYGLSAGAATVAVATLVAFAIHVLFHELAHALTCKHFGREVHRVGVGWYLFLPSAFVDTSDIWMSGKRPRIAVSWAGPYANFLISGLAVVLLPFAHDPTLEAILFQVAVIGYVVAVLNLNPLAEFDGYYMLMDWLEIPNLRSKALGYLGALLWRTEPDVRDPRFHRIGLVYGLLTGGYTLFIALTVLTLYQKFLQAQLARALPSVVATLIGWALAGVLAALIVQGAWSQVRAGALRSRPQGGDLSTP